ncbi:acyl-CoA dehydratase activase [Anaerotardibacter muris]|uniref:acyl-CoA dehydratase activase n=1 Tax=Anaerotardibacter muris TaxID=2941505 RepID=UPI00203C2643|nr:acyl-CoA dehydratase activase [Anaerotardibacter muris]
MSLTYIVGIDIGSTTVKAVVLDPLCNKVVLRSYQRHHSRQVETAESIIEQIGHDFPDAMLKLVFTGSGGATVAQALGAGFIQEVAATSLAIQKLHPAARTIIELGGQDAKVVLLTQGEDGTPQVSDMRMNGSCAGGTGAFIDEIAALLDTPVEQFNSLAQAGDTVHAISGRCGVYAKTDIQPLLNSGVAKEDIALSVFHAIAKQTIGGLAQGCSIDPPVVFAGGPLLFNPRLIDVFAERLGLSPDQVIIPDHPETLVALGAAFAANEKIADSCPQFEPAHVAKALKALASEHEGTIDNPPLFASEQERTAFDTRHGRTEEARGPQAGLTQAYLGIDAGSTTTKVALIAKDGSLLDFRYGPNNGEPIETARAFLLSIYQAWQEADGDLEVLGFCTTGYGEDLLAEAFKADCHVVETVAHSRAALEAQPGATFVLDIGGQDMKAIWLDNGIVTDIIINEACSSGCGSFLEGFAASLGFEREQIAQAAFASKSPASLGSRCTVFMTSSVISEQRNGKSPEDIMAGLCRAIIENLFTKVIRVSNKDKLGDAIVVQGGTFCNDAVLKCFEDYLGREVTRATNPALTGAIGAALIAREQRQQEWGATKPAPSRFIGFEALKELSYEREDGVVCSLCSNQCPRTMVRFSTGAVHVTGNRCERGARIEKDIAEPLVADLDSYGVPQDKAKNLFNDRKSLLLKKYPYEQVGPSMDVTIGLPRVLSIWDNAPFWTTMLRALGFEVVLSSPSTREMFEAGLPSVMSDTICFPAKLAHGHVRNLVKRQVDRVFMPIVATVEAEGMAETADSMCAVVKGYPLVIRSSDDPESTWDMPFDTPIFHWPKKGDRVRQLCDYFEENFGIAPDLTERAIAQGDAAQQAFRTELVRRGEAVIDQARKQGTYAVVIASRPYHNDPLVNHDVQELFTSRGVSVIPADALPGLDQVDLQGSRLDIVNNFHARMLASALIVARDENLEYAQLVSFGCGHDAYLSDEIVRMMKETTGKVPLILKVDESDATGPLGIRVRSFLETNDAKHRKLHARSAYETQEQQRARLAQTAELGDPYEVKFYSEDVPERTILVPNTSHAFSMVMSAVFAMQGVRTVSLGIGREEAIRLGKRYVHNDICFPAQIVIGEALSALESGKYDPNNTAVMMAKYLGDCRLTHYSALLRKALDDAGYEQVPIVTNDDQDDRNLHPGFKFNTLSALRTAFCLPMIDAYEELLRKIRPYELVPGSADAAFDEALDLLIEGLVSGGIRGAKRGFKRGIDVLCSVEYDRSVPRPKVLIVGEYLLNFHPGANNDIEGYLENNGFEVVEARMTDVIRKTYFYRLTQVREFKVERSIQERAFLRITDMAFEAAHRMTDRIARKHPLYEPPAHLPELVKESDSIIHHGFDAGEGVLIPAEILHNYKKGLRSFVILQPFGCLPNHIVGRGIVKSLRKECPDARILTLDYDPDVSIANVENRLQMLIMSSK